MGSAEAKRVRGPVFSANSPVMKVLMVSKACVVEAHHGKLRELVKMGVDLTVILPPRWGAQKAEVSEAEGYKVRVMRCWLTPYNHFHFYPARIGNIDADIVHLEEEPWSLVTHQFMRKCSRARKPVVFTTWQNVRKNYPVPFNWFERYTFSHAEAGVAGTKEIRDILRAKGFEKAVSVIPLGVDPERFKETSVIPLRKKLGLENAFLVGYIGRMVHTKGLPDLIHAMTLLPPACVLVMIGDGELRGELERLAQSIGVASRVRWIPWLHSLEVPTYTNLLDVSVLPSRTQTRSKEQFGRVLVEAMACEKAVVGSTTGGIPEVVGDAGLIYHEREVEALAAHLRCLYQNPELRRSLGTRGRARVLARYTHRRIAQQHLELYQEVLSSHKN